MEEILVKELKVERKVYNEKTGRYSYFVKGTVRGREAKAEMAAPDVPGYDLLDLVFNGSNTADLVMRPFAITDKQTGEVLEGFSYLARSVDEEDGEVYDAPIKPRGTAKHTFKMMLKQLGYPVAK